MRLLAFVLVGALRVRPTPCIRELPGHILSEAVSASEQRERSQRSVARPKGLARTWKPVRPEVEEQEKEAVHPTVKAGLAALAISAGLYMATPDAPKPLQSVHGYTVPKPVRPRWKSRRGRPCTRP